MKLHKLVKPSGEYDFECYKDHKFFKRLLEEYKTYWLCLEDCTHPQDIREYNELIEAVKIVIKVYLTDSDQARLDKLDKSIRTNGVLHDHSI